MMHQMTGDDALSLSMFWAGALMVFTPLIGGGLVLGIWWRQRRVAQRRPPGPTGTALPSSEAKAPPFDSPRDASNMK
jgi:hypothetical protein